MQGNMVRLGERRTERPVTFGEGEQHEGKVVYIHPRGRWYTVEFEVTPVIKFIAHGRGRRSEVVVRKGQPVKMRESFLREGKED